MKQIGNYFIDTTLYYDPKNHFWLKEHDGFVRMGFDPLLQETSGSFVAIIFENKDKQLNKGEAFGSVEAEKHVAQLIMPISGKVIVINDDVLTNPRLMNTDPYGHGWLVEIESTNFENEKEYLLKGETAITEWVTSEIHKYEDKGWIARP